MFARRTKRVQLNTPALLTTAEDSFLGSAVDLGPRGVAVVTRGRLLQRGVAVAVLLDPATTSEDLPELRGTVVSVASNGLGYRYGIRLDVMPAGVRASLERITDAVVTTASERWYQSALAHLAAGRLPAAREDAIQALKASSHPHHRALVHRVNAEEALQAGKTAIAAREIAAARVFQPTDPELAAMANRVTSAAPRSLVSRLFG
jgi:hypothetical protein